MPTPKTLAAAFLFASTSLFSLVALGQAAPPAKPAKPSTPALTPDKVAFFETKIRPVLQANCFSCHGGGKEGKSGGLDMSSRAALLKGGSSGPVAVLGKPSADSLLMHAVRYQDREMPPSGKLPQEEIDALAKWVDMGMPWPDRQPAAKDGAMAFHGPPPVNAQTRKWWSFVPVKAVAPPVIKDGKSWVNTPLDAFVLAKLQAKKLHPNPRCTTHRAFAPRYLRLNRAAADAGRNPRFFGGQIAERLFQSRGSFARLAQIRRKMGASLAGFGALCGNQ